MRRTGRGLLGLVGSTLVVALLAGCPAKQEVATQHIFYPSKEFPRLQFLMSFSDATAWAVPKSSFAGFIAGEKVAQSGEILKPYGVACRDGKIYVCDVGTLRIHVFDVVNRTYGTLGTSEQIGNPVNITISPDGTRYVSNNKDGKVAVFDAQDQFVGLMGDPTRCIPDDVAVGKDNLYVANVMAGNVEVWTKDGKYLRSIGKKGLAPGEFQAPLNLAVGPTGSIFVSDLVSSQVSVFNPQGQFINVIGRPGDRPGDFARPKGIAIDREGNVYVADSQWEKVQVFLPTGRLLMFFGEASPAPEGLGLPAGVAIDYTSLNAFRPYMDKDFQPEYLLLVANQYGKHKVNVYAFGRSKTVNYSKMPTSAPAESTTEPATRPAGAPTTQAAPKPPPAPTTQPAKP